MSELPEWVREPLRRIGLPAPDPGNRLHVELVNAVMDAGAGASLGVRLQACRFVFAWELRAAGEAFAAAKTNYEHKAAKVKAQLMLADGLSGVKADAVAEADDEVYELKLAFRVAEHRERACRKFLDAIETQVDVWRTERADERAVDRAHAGGFAGGAV